MGHESCRVSCLREDETGLDLRVVAHLLLAKNASDESMHPLGGRRVPCLPRNPGARPGGSPLPRPDETRSCA